MAVITQCPHCGFESEDDEMCQACGALFEEIQTPPTKEMTAPETTTCPHCGFESEDDEMCQACGALFEDTPVRDISFTEIVGGIFSWLQDKGIHGVDYDSPLFIDDDDPAFFDLPGGTMYFHYHHADDK